MGSKGIVASTAAMAVLLQEGIGDTIRVSLTPEPGGDRTKRSPGRAGAPADDGAALVRADGHGVPGLRPHDQHAFQELAEKIQAYLRAQMPAWRARYPGVETMQVAVMGCVVNGPGESKLANIGISLPGTGETPVAPVYVDGEKTVTLKGERIAEEFQRIVDDYVRATYGGEPRAAHLDARTEDRSPSRRSREPDGRTAASRPRHERRAARRGGAVGAPRGRRARRVRASTATATCACRSSSRRALFVRGIGDATDIVETGDVHVRGQAERREPDAAPRGDRRHRPRRDRAQPHLRAAAARVDRGADVPPRAAAEGPLPAVPSVRRRGARLRRARTSTPSRS